MNVKSPAFPGGRGGRGFNLPIVPTCQYWWQPYSIWTLCHTECRMSRMSRTEDELWSYKKLRREKNKAMTLVRDYRTFPFPSSRQHRGQTSAHARNSIWQQAIESAKQRIEKHHSQEIRVYNFWQIRIIVFYCYKLLSYITCLNHDTNCP